MRKIIIQTKNKALWEDALNKSGVKTGEFTPGVSRPGTYYSSDYTNEPNMGRLEIECSGTLAHKIWVAYKETNEQTK